MYVCVYIWIYICVYIHTYLSCTTAHTHKHTNHLTLVNTHCLSLWEVGILFFLGLFINWAHQGILQLHYFFRIPSGGINQYIIYRFFGSYRGAREGKGRGSRGRLAIAFGRFAGRTPYGLDFGEGFFFTWEDLGGSGDWLALFVYLA